MNDFARRRRNGPFYRDHAYQKVIVDQRCCGRGPAEFGTGSGIILAEEDAGT